MVEFSLGSTLVPVFRLGPRPVPALFKFSFPDSQTNFSAMAKLFLDLEIFIWKIPPLAPNKISDSNTFGRAPNMPGFGPGSKLRQVPSTYLCNHVLGD